MMGVSWYEPNSRRIPKRVWLGFQKSMGVLVGGNHTSSRFCTHLMRNMGEMENLRGFKALKWQALHGSLARRLAIRTLMFAIVISMLPLMQLVFDVDPTKPFWSFNGCGTDMGFMGPDSLLGRVLKPVTPTAFPHLRSGMCKEGLSLNLTMDVVRELVSKNLVSYGGKALCIGDESSLAVSTLREMGFSDVDELQKHPFFMLKQKQVVCELDVVDNSYDFVIARDLRKVAIPALLVNEVERVLKPGGVAAMLVGTGSSSRDSLIRSATSISSFLQSSDIVDVVSLGSFDLVAFKKRPNRLGFFGQYRLPENCPSITRSKPLVDKMEPILDEKPKGNDNRISYLPSFVDVPSKGKLVYIDMGAKEAANFSNGNWFLPSYPIDSKAFSAYIVDHDALVLSSHVKSPGVTFIYHPALGGNIKEKTNSYADAEPLVDDDEFDFLIWFKETVEFADFVVLKMNVGKPEKKFLSELFESGIICFVDELFLHFPDLEHNENGREEDSHTDLIKSLRNVGVFSHQWWGK
ncbi:uncharacterized protein LOC141590107 [Silene latifolia]|uniref:uncharacterized protein LOC141590107 n=1 Tax=Silene latifolia TaxID=37657 RepID=UPI003D781BC9